MNEHDTTSRMIINSPTQGASATSPCRGQTSNGFSLIEAIFTLAIITLLSVGLVSVSAAAFNSVRRAATDDRLRALERAISGDPVIVLNEARTSFGFVGDMGTLPVTLEDLWVKGSQTAFSFDTAKKAGAGWTGPYLETDIVETIAAAGIDAWGTDLSYDNTHFLDSDFGANALGKLISFGSDGIAGGNDDITLHFFDAEIQSRVQGYVRDDDKNGVPGVGVTVNYPQTGALTSQTLQTDSLGYYFFADIPFGNRSLTIEPRLVLAPDTAIVTGQSNDTVELVVKNFASTDTTITSMVIEFSIQPPDYFDTLRLGNTTVFNNLSPRFASGDTASSFSETVGGTGLVTESVQIRIQSSITDVADIVIGDIGRGSSLTIEMQDFEDVATGNGNDVDMTGVIFEITFSDGSVVVATPTDPSP